MSLTESIISFFFNDTATTEIYTLSLHDALPISTIAPTANESSNRNVTKIKTPRIPSPSATSELLANSPPTKSSRSEEHTSELQSHSDLVCRLLLEKKKKKITNNHHTKIDRYILH